MFFAYLPGFFRLIHGSTRQNHRRLRRAAAAAHCAIAPRCEQLETRRLLTAGVLDRTFDGDGRVSTALGESMEGGVSIVTQSDGKILVAGYSYNGSDYDFALTRYNSDGSLDATFGGGNGKVTTDFGSSSDIGQSVAAQSDGKILVAGYSDNGSDYDFALARYNSDGSLDATFGGGDGKVTTDFALSNDRGRAVAAQSDGKILVAGASHNGSNHVFALARYNRDGALDATFDGDGKTTTAFGAADAFGNAMATRIDGKIVVAGSTWNGSNHDFALARYNADGGLDLAFDGDGKTTTAFGLSHDEAFSVTIHDDGKILAAGKSNNGSNDDFALARYNADGGLDLGFDGDGKTTTAFGASHDVGRSVIRQGNGKILVAGYTLRQSRYNFALARYTYDGKLDSTFGGGDGKATADFGAEDAFGYSVATQPDRKIVVAGAVVAGSASGVALARYQGDPSGSLTGSLSDGNLTITDIHGGKDNQLTLRIVGSRLVISDAKEVFAETGTNFFIVVRSAVTGSITIHGQGGNDTLTVDLTRGDPIPVGGVTFHGGGHTGAPGDALRIVGGNQANVVYTHTSPHDGSVAMSGFGTIHYTGLEPITNTGRATNVEFILPGVADAGVSLSDLGGGLTRLASTTPTFERTDFAAPLAGGTLTIRLGANDQTITIGSLSLNANTSVVIDGGGGNDTIRLNDARLAINVLQSWLPPNTFINSRGWSLKWREVERFRWIPFNLDWLRQVLGGAS